MGRTAVLMSMTLSALRVIIRAKTEGTSSNLAVRVMNSAALNLPPQISWRAAAHAAGVWWKLALSVMSP